MKRIIAVLMCAAFMLSFSACGKDTADVSGNSSQKEEPMVESAADISATDSEEISKPSESAQEEPSADLIIKQLAGKWVFTGGMTEAEELGTDYMNATLTFYEDGTADYEQTIFYDEPVKTVYSGMSMDILDAEAFFACEAGAKCVRFVPDEPRVTFFAAIMPDGTLEFQEWTDYGEGESPFIFTGSFVRG